MAVELGALFSRTVNTLRSHFLRKNFVEVHPQSSLSILAACEDPATVASFQWEGEKWPLPQTGQMWLEHVLLDNPEYAGVFCVSSSYRAEPNPVPGRHKTMFSMCEFEIPGGHAELEDAIEDMLGEFDLGAAQKVEYSEALSICGREEGEELTHADEATLSDHWYGRPVFLNRFPFYTSPFWNMKRDGDVALKTDVILGGMETVGAAERETDTELMRHMFFAISDGQYASLLFNQFGEERVRAELEAFLSKDFFPRSGGGIGMTRLMSALA